VPGSLVENVGGVCYVSTRAYPLEAARGPAQLGSLLTLAPAVFQRYYPVFRLDAATDYRRAAFLDTETTGLGNGAGVYAFMIGVGTFEPWADLTAGTGAYTHGTTTHFVVRQYFMRSPAEERAVLIAVAELLDGYEMTVTFNGRTFDLPLLRARYAQNRRFAPLRGGAALLAEDRPHLDLLHPARRLWRKRLQSCRLSNLEAMILGLQRSEDDVPGYLIPALYTDYIRSGNAAEMRRVFYHNCEDIVSMVALAEQLSRAYDEKDAPPVHAEDLAALGRVYEQAGQLDQAEAAYRRAVDTMRAPRDRADLFARLGQLLKKQNRWDEAAEVWQLWLTSVPGVDPTPYEELAKYCEWHLNDLEQAEMWTGFALHSLHTASTAHGFPGAPARLEHRLARLQRRRSSTNDAPGTAPAHE
jgi:uncharacterized protein YprB with RNaseH-like and TPR domain